MNINTMREGFNKFCTKTDMDFCWPSNAEDGYIHNHSVTKEMLTEIMDTAVDIAIVPNSGGIDMTVYYPNGYGLSIIKHPGSYGWESDQWEAAVLKKTEKGGYDLDYCNDLCGDVIGFLTDKDVINLIQCAKKLNNEGKLPDGVEFVPEGDM